MFNKLSIDIISIVQDFAGVNEYWVRRFSVDVLPLINKQYRVVSVENGNTCANCYIVAIAENSLYGTCMHCFEGEIAEFDVMSFEEFSKDKMTRRDVGWRVFADAGFDTFNSTYSGAICFNHSNGEFMYEFHRGPFSWDYASPKYIRVMKRLGITSGYESHKIFYD